MSTKHSKMESIEKINADSARRWKTLVDCAKTVTKLNPSEKKKLQQTPQILRDMLKQMFENNFSNPVYPNNIHLKLLIDSNCDLSVDFRQQQMFNSSVGYSWLEILIRLLLKLVQNKECGVDVFYFKETIILMFRHLRLNDGMPYHYLLQELLSLLVDLNRLQNSYLERHDASCFLSDIQQFKRCTEEVEKLQLNDYLIKDVDVPLGSLQVIRIYYVQLLEILTEFIEPIDDQSSALSDKVCQLIELNLVCSTRQMDRALVNFVINCFAITDHKSPCFQKYFLFVCSITERHHIDCLPQSSFGQPAPEQHQLDRLWNAFLDSLSYMPEENKTIHLMRYLVENSISLHKYKSTHLLQCNLSKILFKIFDQQFDNQRGKIGYHHLVTRVLDFYSTNLAEFHLQNDSWCKLIKRLLIEDHSLSLSINSPINYSYLFKFWEFLNQNADHFLFESSNLLIKFINYANTVLSCLNYISVRNDILPDFFNFDFVVQLVNVLMQEFKNPQPSIEPLKDELIEHIYLVMNKFVKLANQLQQELSAEQIAIFYLPWHERKLKFVKEQQQVLNTLSRRSFKKSEKFLGICLGTISELRSIEHHSYQIDLFDYILNNEFGEMKQLVRPVLVFCMFITNRFSQEKFSSWLNFIIENEDQQFIASTLGSLSCLLFKNCEAIYGVVDESAIRVELVMNCNQCENLFEVNTFEGLDNSGPVIDFIRKEFTRYLTLGDLELLNTLINKSSRQFFNHIDIDQQLIENVLNLFDLVDFDARKSFRKLLYNMFKSLKTEKERFFISFKERFFNTAISASSELELIAKFENIALMCDYFPKHKLQIIIYMLQNGVLHNRNFIYHTTIILNWVVFKHEGRLNDYFLENINKITEAFLQRILEQDIKPEVAFQLLMSLVRLIAERDIHVSPVFVEAFHFIFPYLIKNHNHPPSRALLNYLLHNKVLKYTNLEELFKSYFESIIVYFVRNMNVDEIKNAFDYIKSLAKDICKFFSEKGTIVYTLLFEYCNQERSINYILSMFNSEEYLENKEAKKQYVDFNENSAALSAYLTEKMGGYLLNLNRQFLHNQDVPFKIVLLKSLNLIIKIVSKQTISSYFEKFIGILRSAFKQPKEHEDYKNYVIYMYTVWDTLINKCDKDDLVNNLSVICKNLMDLLPIDPAGVSQVFQKLIVPNEEKLTAKLKELHFLPTNCRLLNTTYQVVSKHMFKMPKNDLDTLTFRHVLKILEESLQVENPEIKFLHYKKLLQVLNENEKCSRSFCSSGNDLVVQPIISRLIHKLITDSKMNDSQLRSVIGECLGEFSALDPGRLEVDHSNDRTKDIPFFFDLKESDFAVLLINKLVACFDLINETKLQDCINYALQEILKIYNVSQSPQDSIWSSIPSRSRSICKQLFTSRFIMEEKIHTSSHPIYKESQSFDDWIIKLCIALSRKVKDKFAKSIFDSLSPLINNNTAVAEYFLPFIVVILIKGEKEQTDSILEEIDYLIRSCLPQDLQRPQNIADSSINQDQENARNETNKGPEITVLYEAKSEQYKCVHALFNLLDFLTNWRKIIKNSLNLCIKGVKNRSTHDQNKLWQSYNAVNDFLCEISKAELSILASTCQSYDRAMMYLEEYIFQNKDELANNYDNLQKLYVALEEPDGVEGILVCRKEEPNLYNSILSHEVNGELQEAISCCEKANKLNPNELTFSKVYLKCLLLLGHENTAKIFATSSIEQQPEFQYDLQPFIVEAAWKMGEWDNLEQELSRYNVLEKKFEVCIVNLFISIRKHDHQQFDNLTREYRLNEVDQIAVSSAGNRAYARNYPKLVRLHMLNEIEHFYKHHYINLRSNNKERISQLTKRFTVRTKNVQTSVRYKEPIINLQRVLLNICSSSLNCSYDSELAELWLSSAKLARKSNNFQSAYKFSLEIQMLEQQNVSSFSKNLKAKIIIEKAKYHWQKDTLEDKEKAVRELCRGIEHLNIQMQESNFAKLRPCLTFAKLHLLYNNYSEKTLNLDTDKLCDNYTAITTCYSSWEESYYNLGIYYDSLTKTIDRQAEKAEYLDKVVKNLGESLKYGSKHVYESMPKLLTSWCDLGDFKVTMSRAKQASNKTKRQQDENDSMIIDEYCESATRSIRQFLETVPPYNFYTAISQLTSRMCHPLSSISEKISDIIRVLVRMYPDQTIWLILSSMLSENKVRKEKFEKCLRGANLNHQLLKSYISFGTILCQVCNFKAPGNSFNLFDEFDKLKNILNHAKANNLCPLVPFQCFMNVQLPNHNLDEDQASIPIKDNLVYIHDFAENVQVLRSLVKPKKITIRGSDGKIYVMMCKPKDDLRKDNRTLEFNNLVNRHLRKDSETRKRNLFIKTYTVVPLRHDCGLIEWLNDLEGYRPTVIGTYYREIDNFKLPQDKLNSLYPKKTQNLKESLRIFKEKILSMFPVIYHKFFLNQFQNPTSWYNAKMNFVRSCAVMSIVGYVIGLDDRHGENILINLKTGLLVHVDFNCIFNKGSELEVPEVVPFRLTHNMIDAMGPTGYEGVFRKTCESTLRVMREQREALMSVLTTFVHDPLIEWNGGSKANASTSSRSRTLAENDACEAVNKTAIENLDRIKYRLNGLLGLDVKKEDENKLNRSAINRSMILSQSINNNKIPITVSYQVSHLIEEATSLERLCRMYVGWNSFL